MKIRGREREKEGSLLEMQCIVNPSERSGDFFLLSTNCVTQIENIYLSPCSRHPSLAAQERQHLGFDRLKAQRDFFLDFICPTYANPKVRHSYSVSVTLQHLQQLLFHPILTQHQTVYLICNTYVSHIIIISSWTDFPSVLVDRYLVFCINSNLHPSSSPQPRQRRRAAIHSLATRCRCKSVVTV